MIKKILVVDDSALMRRVLSDIIDFDKRFMQADAASDGLEAYDLILTNPLKYDLIILDINMPKMNGIQLMEKMNSKNIKIPVLIVSTIAREGTTETIRCLELGAFDFITKPDSFLETKSNKFRDKIVSYMCAALSMPFKPAEQTPPSDTVKSTSKSGASSDSADGPMSYTKTTFERKPHVRVSDNASKLIALACSTGGPKALQSVIPNLPKNLAAPMVIVQHMPEGFTGSLAQRLDEMSKVSVKEASNGDVLKNGTVYIAKGGAHLVVRKKGHDYVCELDNSPARNGLRPCADIMYESLRELDLDEIICVVLTGMGSDGTRGIGGLGSTKNIYVIAQDEASSTVYGMPRMVKEAGVTDEVVALGSVADAITKIVGTR